MRNESNVEPISLQEIELVRSDIGAVSYMECSALTRQGLKEVFDEAINVGMGGMKKKISHKQKQKCSLL